ncbi:hypothetical protein [Clostridium cadaveris]|uniref:hypothetical protein n=1 Tax=Clostridium cadaveris TaxID=1529 RepID=UPI000C07FD00|nr:hypothetical protein [Clostridium cadaveris]
MKITAEFNSNEELVSFINTFGAKSITCAQEGMKETFEKVTQAPIVEKPIEESKEEVKVEEKSKKEEPVKEDKPVEEPKEEKVIKITKEQVRAVFSKLLKAGKQQEAKDLTAKYGASKIPEIKEEDYEAVLKEAEELL